jgi:lipopolysaccharide export system permease protein
VWVLSRYVLSAFLRAFCLGLGGCVALFVLVEAFDRMDEFVARQVFWSDAARYLMFRLPDIVYQLTPAAFLLASVLTFSRLNQGNEITAIRAGGIAPLRLTRPLFVAGLVGGLLLLLAHEYLVPYTNHLSHVIWRTRIQRDKKAVQLGQYVQGPLWYRQANRIWHIQQVQPHEQRLVGVSIYVLDQFGAIQQRYDVTDASWEPQGWLLRQGTVRAFTPDGAFAGPPEVFAQRHLAVPERFVEMGAVRKQADEMSHRELLATIRQLRYQGLSDTRLRTELQARLAYAAACIIMAGFGIPVALRLNRSGGTVRAVGLTVSGGFGYWVVHSITLALGYQGQLPPFVAAWGTNLCFALGSVYLTYRLQ